VAGRRSIAAAGRIEPFRFDVDEGEQVFHATVHFPDGHV
jgi:hypothetical protein